MFKYYSPEVGFTIQVELWIQNEPNTNMNQVKFFDLIGFFVTLCSLNGLQAISTVETMNFRIPCFIKIPQTPSDH